MGKLGYDKRPICRCSAYHFPHKIGGKCKGEVFFDFYLNNNRDLCNGCNCFNDDGLLSCDVLDGRESIKESECYLERLNCFPGENLPISFMEYE